MRSLNPRFWALVCAACISATTVLASEVVVQNDSVTEGGLAYVVGDFAEGEIAAARRTAPCDGTIVAVQILWRSAAGGGLPSVEEAIYIWDGPNFPTPSSVLAYLEGPVLTPGFINEYRYLDEANSVPIAVPVTSGQQVYIGLQFYNPTDIASGTPSVVRDLNGCQAGKNAMKVIPGGWINPCSFLGGDFVIRAVVDCPSVTGACCLTDGSCVVTSSSSCSSQGGIYQGNNTTCQQVSCPQPLGACCFSSADGCVNMNQANCAAAGGFWGGAGTNCASYVCFPEGACCLPDGACLDAVTATDCEAQGGVFQGDSSVCANVNCPLPDGACCFATGFCMPLLESECGQAGATWKGPGTDCVDSDTNGIADVCEADPVCRGDCNCDGLVDFRDINYFVGALAGAMPCALANFDINEDEVLDFRDINPFVALLASGLLPIECD
jgi:hypothetical protein